MLLFSACRGEKGFYQLQHHYIWAKRPMVPRISSKLNSHLPVSLIVGGSSWYYKFNTKVIEEFSAARPEDSYVRTYLVEDANHHVHAHKPEEFNENVREILKIVDSFADLIPELKTTTV